MVTLSLPCPQASPRHHPREGPVPGCFLGGLQRMCWSICRLHAQIRRCGVVSKTWQDMGQPGDSGMGGWVVVPSGFEGTNLSLRSSP